MQRPATLSLLGTLACEPATCVKGQADADRLVSPRHSRARLMPSSDDATRPLLALLACS